MIEINLKKDQILPSQYHHQVQPQVRLVVHQLHHHLVLRHLDAQSRKNLKQSQLKIQKKRKQLIKGPSKNLFNLLY